MTEALGALWRVSAHESSLASSRALLAERTRCAAGLLVKRQTDSARAHEFVRPDLVQGTWMKSGQTQIDDQQHSLSGLLATLEILK